jgi:hypothetical protein
MKGMSYMLLIMEKWDGSHTTYWWMGKIHKEKLQDFFKQVDDIVRPKHYDIGQGEDWMLYEIDQDHFQFNRHVIHAVDEGELSVSSIRVTKCGHNYSGIIELPEVLYFTAKELEECRIKLVAQIMNEPEGYMNAEYVGQNNLMTVFKSKKNDFVIVSVSHNPRTKIKKPYLLENKEYPKIGQIDPMKCLFI